MAPQVAPSLAKNINKNTSLQKNTTCGEQSSVKYLILLAPLLFSCMGVKPPLEVPIEAQREEVYFPAENGNAIAGKGDAIAGKEESSGKIDAVALLAAISNAELPDSISSKLQAAFKENPAFIADLLLCLEGNPALRELVDKQHPLPQGYAPADLVRLKEGSYRFGSARELTLRSSAASALGEMAAGAKADGVVLSIGSAYRSYDYQIRVYNRNVQQMGMAAADRESARPGQSQHQTGLTIDFSPISDSFAQTAAAGWLAANASRFGWSLSYPDGYEAVTGYRWESWHYRYVGKELAAFIDNYFDGVQHYALRFLNELAKESQIYLFTVAGMPIAEYEAAMNAKWQEISYAEEKPLDLNYKINKKYAYKEYEEFILNLAKHNYVTVYKMGETAEGRAIYNIEIFNHEGSADSSEIRTIMVNAGTHGNETMGPHAALKMADDFIKRVQSDQKIQEHLKRVKITILPCLNPDGREHALKSGGIEKKSNAEGIDINRAFPSINAGFLMPEDGKRAEAIAMDSNMNYPGEYLGAAREVKVAMKWLGSYMPNGSAPAILIDLHQAGNGIYFSKPFGTDSSNARQEEFYGYLAKALNTGNSLVYRKMFDPPRYGYNGSGGTLTDYAYGMAMGLRYSAALGRQAMAIDGRENAGFVFATIEMTSSKNYKGFSPLALSVQRLHYNTQNYDGLLVNLIKWALELPPNKGE